MNNNSLTYDVVIIGGGVAGCATAIALKNNAPHLSIAIIERGTSKPKVTERIGETLPPQANQILQQLGIWDSFLNCDFLHSYGTAAAWGNNQLHHNEFIYSVNGYGWHLDRAIFDSFMISEAKKRKVDFYFDTQINLYETRKNYWELSGNNNNNPWQIYAQFIVDASGRNAVVASHLKIPKTISDGLIGIYQFYNYAERAVNKGTYIESDENGWWYSTTLPNNKLVVAYMTDSDIAKKYALKNLNTFNTIISNTKHTSSRIIFSESNLQKPKIVAAHTQQLSRVVGEKWLAVGDACVSYDPLSSLGIFKSLSTSRYAAYAILDYTKNNYSGLLKYQKIMDQETLAYHQKKHAYYLEEKRFKNSAFWERRHAITY